MERISHLKYFHVRITYPFCTRAGCLKLEKRTLKKKCKRKSEINPLYHKLVVELSSQDYFFFFFKKSIFSKKPRKHVFDGRITIFEGNMKSHNDKND